MVVRQNARRSHVESKDSQLRILLYVFDELISEGSRIRFAIDGNLPCGLVVRSDLHAGGRQTFEKTQQDFDRVITRIDGWSKRLQFYSVARPNAAPGPSCAIPWSKRPS